MVLRPGNRVFIPKNNIVAVGTTNDVTLQETFPVTRSATWPSTNPFSHLALSPLPQCSPFTPPFFGRRRRISAETLANSTSIDLRPRTMSSVFFSSLLQTEILFPRPAAAGCLRHRRPSHRLRVRRTRLHLVPCSDYKDRVSVTDVSGELDLDRYVGNGNGRGGGIEYAEVTNGSIEVLLNGNGAKNGSLVRYSGGNEAAAVEVDGGSGETDRKKRVEEIGKEDAWFKEGGEQPQVRITSRSSLAFPVIMLFYRNIAFQL